MNAIPEEDPADRLYFPQLAVGEIIQTELSVENLGIEPTLVTLTAHREDGRLFGPEEVATNPVIFVLAAADVRRLDLGTVFGFAEDEVHQGWLEVSAPSRSLQPAADRHDSESDLGCWSSKRIHPDPANHPERQSGQ